MNTVITINLNGRAYQIEQQGYTALQTYFSEINKSLEHNPDKVEILKDFEQAIAEKCNRFLTSYKNVVTTVEMTNIISEMGPIEHGASQSAGPDGQRTEQTRTTDGTPKRLYRIREGALISGVCTGIAAYFNIDTLVVRLAFIILTIVTSGGWILIYFIMTVLIPHANTEQEKAAASGSPFTAQELMRRARETYARFDSPEWKEQKQTWKRNWREQRRAWKEQWHAHAQKARVYEQYDKSYHAYHRDQVHWYDVLNGVFWIVLITFGSIFIYTHQSQAINFVHTIPQHWHNLVEAIRNI